MSHLVLQGLSKRFDDLKAVDGVSLTVDKGELLVLVGPSGCGKTTILRLIAGFEAPDAGTLQLASQNLHGVPPERRGVGVVFQHYALFPHMTVAGNVSYGLRFARQPLDRKRRIQELLELVDLQGLEKRRPHQLSAGQRQRVALARALAPQPNVLLLDEPLSALDVQLRQSLRLEIRRLLKAAGTTALYVTHDQEEALAIADRVAVMCDGRLEQIDAPQTVYQRPVTPFVANFVGQGNVLQFDVVEQTPSGVVVQRGQTRFRLPFKDGEKPAGRIRVLIRPEQFRVDDQGEFQGTLKQVEYLGPLVRLYVNWEGDRVLVLALGKVLERRWRAEQSVRFSVDPQRLWVLP